MLPPPPLSLLQHTTPQAAGHTTASAQVGAGCALLVLRWMLPAQLDI